MRRASIGLALTVLAVAHAAAADAVADAHAMFDEAAKAFAHRRYAEAAQQYEASAELSPHPAPLVNAAEAWELGNDPVRAARDCDAARKLTTDDAGRLQIDRRLARLSRRVATLEVDGPSGLAIRIDDGPNVAPPVRLRLAPGGHALALVDLATGETRAHDAVLVEGETRHLVLAKTTWDAPEPIRPPPVAPPAPPTRTRPPIGSWVSLGIGGAAGVGAVVLGAVTLQTRSEFDQHPTAETADRFERERLVTNVLVGVTATAILVAGALWLFAPTRRSRD